MLYKTIKIIESDRNFARNKVLVQSRRGKRMNYKVAIEVIKSNYPPETYTILREALDLSIKLLEQADNTEPLKDGETITITV